MINSYSFGLATILLLCFGTSALGLTIQPLRPTATIPPGSDEILEITLTNEKEIPNTFEITFNDLSLERERFTGWINLEPLNKIALAPGESKTLLCGISVPPDASGELCGRLAFTEAPSETPGAAPLAIRTKISIPFSVFIKGTELYAAEIQSIRTKPKDSQRIEIVLENKGNVHLRPVGQCTITRSGVAQTIAECKINQDRNPIYPGQSMPLTGQITETLEPGDYTAHVNFNLGKDGNRIEKTIAFQVPEIPLNSVKSDAL